MKKKYTLIITFVFGLLCGNVYFNLTRPKITESPVDKAIDIVANYHYPNQYTKEELEEMAINGIFDKLDKYSIYYNSKELYDSKTNKYKENLGIVLSYDDKISDYPYIEKVKENSPAQKAGINTGMLLIKINGEDVKGLKETHKFLSDLNISKLLYAFNGEKISLTLENPLTSEIKTYDVIGGITESKSLEYKKLENNIGYIKIYDFNGGQSKVDEFKKILKSLNMENINKLIIDLRNNSGGNDGTCVDMMSMLIENNIKELYKFKLYDKGKMYEGNMPRSKFSQEYNGQIDVLVNSHTASAAEIFSKYLQDISRAKIIGEKTYGKGIGEITRKLNDISSIQVANSEIFYKNGKSLEEIGVIPDKIIEMDPILSNNNITDSIRDYLIKKYGKEKAIKMINAGDIQLKYAIENQ